MDAASFPPTTKPNLFIVGAPKCGTTAWTRYLSSHPRIFFPSIKEPHFFSPDLPPTGPRIDSEREYLDLFASAGNARVIGEASVRYLFSKVAASRIAEFNPGARILIFLRDQADFLRSRHNQLLYGGDEIIADFERAWRLSGRRSEVEPSPVCVDPRLLDYEAWGRFHEQAERYFACFPSDRIRIFHFDDWSRDPRWAYLEILRFLGVEDDGRTDFPVINEAKRHRTDFIVRLVRSPPPIASAALKLARKLTGRPGFGLANLLYRLDSEPGSSSRISPQLREELRSHYSAENQLLESLICRPD